MREFTSCKLEIRKTHRGNTPCVFVQKSNAVPGELRPKGQGGFAVIWSRGMTSLVPAQVNIKYYIPC